MEDNNNYQEQNYNEKGRPGGFLRFLLILACSVAFVPALSIPWNKTEWVDDWHFYEYSSGFFLRTLKVLLIAISVITWVVLLYIKYKQITDNDDQNE